MIMHEKHKEEYFKMIIKYVNMEETKEQNEALLNAYMESVDEEVFTKYMAELLNHLQMLENDKLFTQMFCFDKAYHDMFLINEVISAASHLNKKARGFYRYYLLRRYGLKELNHGLKEAFDVDKGCDEALLSEQNKIIFKKLFEKNIRVKYEDADLVVASKLLMIDAVNNR